MIFDIQTPIPFFISDKVYKKKMDKVGEDFLYRMKKEDEPEFFAYLNNLIKVREGKI